MGELSVLAGVRGVGKTSFAGNMALACAQHRHPVLFFSLMESAAAVERKCCSIQDWLLEGAARGTAGPLVKPQSLPIDIVCPRMPFITPGQVRELTERLPHVRLVVVDSLRLISTFEDRTADDACLEYIAAMLKRMAIDCHCHVLVLANIRSSTHVDDKENIPLPGGVMDMADVVFSMGTDNHRKDKEIQPVDIFVLRNRHGSTGRVQMLFYKREGAFAEFSLLSAEDLLRQRNAAHPPQPETGAEDTIVNAGNRLANKFMASAENASTAKEKKLFFFGAALLRGATNKDAFYAVKGQSSTAAPRSAMALGSSMRKEFLMLIRMDRDAEQVSRVLDFYSTKNQSKGGKGTGS